MIHVVPRDRCVDERFVLSDIASREAVVFKRPARPRKPRRPGRRTPADQLGVWLWTSWSSHGVFVLCHSCSYDAESRRLED